jgi:hypothetical protein
MRWEKIMDEARTVWFPRLKTYLSGVVWRHEEALQINTRNIRALIRWFFDLVKNVLIVGGLKFLAVRSDSVVLKVVGVAAFASILVYCVTYMQTWQVRLFHPWWPNNFARAADLLVNLAIVAPLFYIIVYTVPEAIDDIAKAQGK